MRGRLRGRLLLEWLLKERPLRLLLSRDQLSKLSAHVEIASKLNHGIELNHLTELGKLEQDLVYGDATSKEVITFLSQGQALPAADKVRACRRQLRFELFLAVAPGGRQGCCRRVSCSSEGWSAGAWVCSTAGMCSAARSYAAPHTCATTHTPPCYCRRCGC